MRSVEAGIRRYFKAREEQKVLFSAADLAAFLGLSIEELRALADDPENGLPVRRAMTRIAAQLESDPRWMGSNSSKSVFLLRQKLYGGYSDKPEKPSRVTVELRLAGIDDD